MKNSDMEIHIANLERAFIVSSQNNTKTVSDTDRNKSDIVTANTKISESQSDIASNSEGIFDIAELSDSNSEATFDLADLISDLEARVEALESKE